MSQKEKVVFIGRFQPFHYGHFILLLLALAEAKGEEITIVIGSADKSRTKDNPLNYQERKAAIINLADALGFSDRIPDKNIIPSNDNDSDDVWKQELEAKVGKNATVISNNDWTNRVLGKNGHKIIKTGLIERRLLEGKKIRDLIRKGHNWQEYVPGILTAYYNQINMVEIVENTANVIN